MGSRWKINFQFLRQKSAIFTLHLFPFWKGFWSAGSRELQRAVLDFFYILPWQLESLRLFNLQVTAQCAISACKREDNDAWHAAVTLSGCPDAKSVGCIHRTHKEFDANLSHRAQMGHFRQPAKVYWPLQAKAPDTSVDHGAECLPVVQEHSETSLRHTLNKMMVED